MAAAEVTRGTSNANEIDNPYVLQLPSSRILCAFRNDSKDPNNGAYTYFRITVVYFEYDGVSWQYSSQPQADPGPVTGVGSPTSETPKTAPSKLTTRAKNSKIYQDTLLRTSTNGGKLWLETRIIPSDGIASRNGMTEVTTVSGSTLMAVFEFETTGIFSINAITSHDDGKTWEERKKIYTQSTGIDVLSRMI